MATTPATADIHSRLGEDFIGLHRLMTAYLSSKALFSAIELGVFDALEDRAHTAEDLAEQLGLPERSTRILLLALQGEDLVEWNEGTYRNTPTASTFLVSSSPGYAGALTAHQDRHFAKMTALTEALKTNAPVQVGDQYVGAFASEPTAWARRWAETFRVASRVVSTQLAAAAPLPGRRHLVDLGCASASYATAFARANPGLSITAVDQPAVAEVAREFVAAEELDGQVSVVGADIFEASFEDCDVALLSHVIQGVDRERARRLIRHVYGWLPENGELLLHSHLPERSAAPFPYVFGLILLINNAQGGEPHGEALTCQWLREAGFREIQVSEVSPISALIRARK